MAIIGKITDFYGWTGSYIHEYLSIRATGSSGCTSNSEQVDRMNYSLNGVTLTGIISRVTTSGYFTEDFLIFYI